MTERRARFAMNRITYLDSKLSNDVTKTFGLLKALAREIVPRAFQPNFQPNFQPTVGTMTIGRSLRKMHSPIRRSQRMLHLLYTYHSTLKFWQFMLTTTTPVRTHNRACVNAQSKRTANRQLEEHVPEKHTGLGHCSTPFGEQYRSKTLDCEIDRISTLLPLFFVVVVDPRCKRVWFLSGLRIQMEKTCLKRSFHAVVLCTLWPTLIFTYRYFHLIKGCDSFYPESATKI